MIVSSRFPQFRHRVVPAAVGDSFSWGSQNASKTMNPPHRSHGILFPPDARLYGHPFGQFPPCNACAVVRFIRWGSLPGACRAFESRVNALIVGPRIGEMYQTVEGSPATV